MIAIEMKEIEYDSLHFASLLIKKDLIDNWRSEAPQVDHIASLINRNKHCVCNDIVIADIILVSCASGSSIRRN